MSKEGNVVIEMKGGMRIERDSGSFAIAKISNPGKVINHGAEPEWKKISWNRTIGAALEEWLRKHAPEGCPHAECIEELIQEEILTRDALILAFSSQISDKPSRACEDQDQTEEI